MLSIKLLPFNSRSSIKTKQLITFALASQLNRQNFYFKNLPNIIGQRHQLEFKSAFLREKTLSVMLGDGSRESATRSILKIPTEGLFNIAQIFNQYEENNFYDNINLINVANSIVTQCTNGLVELKNFKEFLPQFVIKLKSVPVLALKPYLDINDADLLDLSKCIRISPRISKTNLFFSPSKVLSLIFNISNKQADELSVLLKSNKIKNFTELQLFFDGRGYNYRKGLNPDDFRIWHTPITRGLALQQDGNIFFMSELFKLGNGKEIFTWGDLQWLPIK